MKRFYDIQGQLQTVALVAIAFIYGSVTANAQKVRIGVKDASFAKGYYTLQEQKLQTHMQAII